MVEVLGEATVAIEPSQNALDDPSARQDFDAVSGVGSLDDLDGPLADGPIWMDEMNG